MKLKLTRGPLLLVLGLQTRKGETSEGHLISAPVRHCHLHSPPSTVRHCHLQQCTTAGQTVPQEQIAIDSDTAPPPTKGSGSVPCCAMGKCSSGAAKIYKAAFTSSRFQGLHTAGQGISTHAWCPWDGFRPHGVPHIHRAPWLSRAYEVTPDLPLEWCLQKYEQ